MKPEVSYHAKIICVFKGPNDRFVEQTEVLQIKVLDSDFIDVVIGNVPINPSELETMDFILTISTYNHMKIINNFQKTAESLDLVFDPLEIMRWMYKSVLEVNPKLSGENIGKCISIWEG